MVRLEWKNGKMFFFAGNDRKRCSIDLCMYVVLVFSGSFFLAKPAFYLLLM